MGMEKIQSYLNQPFVQERLGFKGHPFVPVSFPVNTLWTEYGDPFISRIPEVSYILDHFNVKILVMNGNNDISV